MSEIQIETFKPPSAGDPVLSEAVRRLSTAYHPLWIYLFGSAARGDAGVDSDYDIMVVVSDNAPAELQRSRRGYSALRDLGIPKDIFVSTAREFQMQLHLKASFPSTIVREGILLYAS